MNLCSNKTAIFLYMNKKRKKMEKSEKQCIWKTFSALYVQNNSNWLNELIVKI